MEQHNNSELYTARVKAGRRVYHIDVKPTINNAPYISISEKKVKDDGSIERFRIMLMAEDVLKFQQAFNDIVDYLKTNYPEMLTHQPPAGNSPNNTETTKGGGDDQQG